MNNNEDLINVFNKIKKALNENDIVTLDELISEDYVGFSLNGTVETKEDILTNFKPGAVILTEYSVEEINFEQFESIGIIYGKGFIAGKLQDINFEHYILFTDIFKVVAGKWKYYKSQNTEIHSA